MGETRGVAAQVRQELKDAGVAMEHVLPLARALVDESKSQLKVSIDWNKFGGLRARVMDRLELQKDMAPEHRRGVAALARRELSSLGLANSDVPAVSAGFIKPSSFRSHIDWVRLGDLEQQVMQLLNSQGEDVDASKRHGIAALARREIKASGVSEELVNFVLRGLVDESKLLGSINWTMLGQLKQRVLDRLAQTRDDASEQRGIAAHMRAELMAAGVPGDRLHLLLRGLVSESKFKESIDWHKLGDVYSINWEVLRDLKTSVLNEMQSQANDASKRGIASHVRRAAKVVGIPEDRIQSFTRAVVDESDFAASVDLSKLGRLDQLVSNHMSTQQTAAALSEHRGVAAFVRSQLEAAGLSKSSIPLAATALVDNSRFKLAIKWNKFAGLKERISHAVLLQEDADTSKKRGIAAHVRQELKAAGVPEDRVHSMAQALVQESEFRSSINWNKIEHLMELQEASPLETRGVAAQVRQELKDAGVATEHVLPLARALVDESKFKSSLNWEKFAQLKDEVLGRV